MNRLVKRYPELMEFNQKLRHDVLDAISDKELSRPVKRGTYSLPLEITACTYRESLIIFAGKASLYLHSLGGDAVRSPEGLCRPGGRPGAARSGRRRATLPLPEPCRLGGAGTYAFQMGKSGEIPALFRSGICSSGSLSASARMPFRSGRPPRASTSRIWRAVSPRDTGSWNRHVWF